MAGRHLPLEAERLRVTKASPRDALLHRAHKHKKSAPTSYRRMWGLNLLYSKESAEDYLRRLAGAFFVVVF